jgi:hypothetical protein
MLLIITEIVVLLQQPDGLGAFATGFLFIPEQLIIKHLDDSIQSAVRKPFLDHDDALTELLLSRLTARGRLTCVLKVLHFDEGVLQLEDLPAWRRPLALLFLHFASFLLRARFELGALVSIGRTSNYHNLPQYPQ